MCDGEQLGQLGVELDKAERKLDAARAERDEARRWSEVWKEERDEARRIARQIYKRTTFLEAVNDLSLDTTNRAQDLAGRLLKFAGRLITERDELRAENARLHDALAQSAAGEVDAVKDAQDAKRELHEVRAHLIESRAAVMAEGAAEKSLRRKAQLYAARQTGKLYEARGRIAELEAVIADMLDHLTEVLWYPNNDPQVEALRAALGKAREEAE